MMSGGICCYHQGQTLYICAGTGLGQIEYKIVDQTEYSRSWVLHFETEYIMLLCMTIGTLR